MPNPIWTTIAPLAGAAMLIAGTSSADTLRCQDRLVSSGDSLYHVQSVCGDPDAAERHVEYRTLRRRVPVACPEADAKHRCYAEEEYTVEVVVDNWTYDVGRNKFVRYLRFESGALTRVTFGDYGYKR